VPADAPFRQKKILRAFGPKDCTLVHLILTWLFRHFHVPGHLLSSGRSSGSRIVLLSEPSHVAQRVTVA
jgi:hypothetical protein